MKSKLRLGIIGAGWMSAKCCEAISATDCVEAYGVYARSLSKAIEFAEKHSIGLYTDDIAVLLQNKEIDAIYIATTNETHAQFAMMAINAGKNVLIEKPFTLNKKQASELLNAAKARGCFVMEAMWNRFLPAVLAIKYLVKTKAIGELRKIKMQTGCILTKEQNARVYDKQLGGGALLDIGVYPLSVLQMVTEAHPINVTNTMMLDAPTGVDVENHITLRYASGLEVEIYVTCLESLKCTLVIEGDDGRLECDDYVFADGFTLTTNDDSRYYGFASAPQLYVYQLEHFALCAEQGRKESYIMPVESTLEVMRLLDESRRAAGYIFPQETSI